ncbi:UNVERIFIED_CONTAM: hypothetical protein GTU68_014522 [Idotea baltica]|nr:hypothetical protein [Idotea baltica]
MALKIRLARGGSKKRPFYSVVVADSRMPRDGRFIEKIGTYDPRLPKESEQRVQIDGQKATDWIAKGAKPTDRVARFLSKMTLEGASAPIYAWEHGNNPKKGEPADKAEALKAAAEEAKNAPAPEPEAAPEEAPAEAAAEEAPAEAEAAPEEKAE